MIAMVIVFSVFILATYQPRLHWPCDGWGRRTPKKLLPPVKTYNTRFSFSHVLAPKNAPNSSTYHLAPPHHPSKWAAEAKLQSPVCRDTALLSPRGCRKEIIRTFHSFYLFISVMFVMFNNGACN